MLLFWIEYVLSILISFFDNKKNRKLILYFFILFALIFIFRDIRINIRSDIDEYRQYYEEFSNQYIRARYNFEPGYLVLNWLFRLFHLPFEALMIFIGAFYCIMFWKASSIYTDHPGMCLLPSLFFLFYYSSGSLRQSVAQILAFYAFSYLIVDPEYEKDADKSTRRLGTVMIRHREVASQPRKSVNRDDLKKYLVFAAVAFLFHRASIILFLIPFLNNRKIRIITLVVFASLFVFQPLLERLIALLPSVYGKYQYYKLVSTVGNGIGEGNLRLYEYILFYILVFFRKRKTGLENLTAQLLELGIFVQVFLSRYIGATYRLLQYTDIGIIFFVICTYYRLYNSTKHFDAGKRAITIFSFFSVIAILVFFRFYRIFSTNMDLGYYFTLVFL